MASPREEKHAIHLICSSWALGLGDISAHTQCPQELVCRGSSLPLSFPTSHITEGGQRRACPGARLGLTPPGHPRPLRSWKPGHLPGLSTMGLTLLGSPQAVPETLSLSLRLEGPRS